MPPRFEEGFVLGSRETVIIGAGLAGISTALHLDSRCRVLEKAKTPGGLCTSASRAGYTFDQTGHWLHLRDQGMKDLVGKALPMRSIDRVSSIRAFGTFGDYPFQANLADYPPEVRTECIQTLIESLRAKDRPASQDFAAYVLEHFGAGIARHFMFPYNTKLWGVPPDSISFDWCQRFVPVPDWKEIVRGAFFPSNGRLGYNVSFVYPDRGGISTLSAALAGRCTCIETETEVKAVNLNEGFVETDRGRVAFGNLVNTTPLPRFVGLCQQVPDDVLAAAAQLRSTRVRYLNLGIRGPALAGRHWIYVPDPALSIYRIGSFSNACPGMAPAGCSSLYVEIRNDVDSDDSTVLAQTIALLSEIGPAVKQEMIEVAEFAAIDCAYVIYDHNYRAARGTVLDWLESKGVVSAGRYGRWVYSSMEDALLDGRQAAETIRKRQ